LTTKEPEQSNQEEKKGPIALPLVLSVGELSEILDESPLLQESPNLLIIKF
jgi:hypothetical protein